VAVATRLEKMDRQFAFCLAMRRKWPLVALEARAVKMLVKRLCQRAGVCGGRGCHRLSDTFAIEFMRAGGDSLTLHKA